MSIYGDSFQLAVVASPARTTEESAQRLLTFSLANHLVDTCRPRCFELFPEVFSQHSYPAYPMSAT